MLRSLRWLPKKKFNFLFKINWADCLSMWTSWGLFMRALLLKNANCVNTTAITKRLALFLLKLMLKCEVMKKRRFFGKSFSRPTCITKDSLLSKRELIINKRSKMDLPLSALVLRASCLLLSLSSNEILILISELFYSLFHIYKW